MNKKVTIHVIKNFPASILNADNELRPKTAMFGGVLRGRISSANIKRNIRMSDIMQELGNMGYRTRTMPAIVGARLMSLGVDDAFVTETVKKLTGFGTSKGNDSDEKEEDGKRKKEEVKEQAITRQTLFVSDAELDVITKVMYKAIQKCDGDLNAFKKIKLDDIKGLSQCSEKISTDMALFGRMVTSDFQTGVDSSVQVAQALSTHALYRENDFFSLMDDMLVRSGDRAATALPGNRDYNSCCYYEYAAIDLDLLQSNMEMIGGDEELVSKIACSFIKSFAYTYSKTGQSSYAAQPLPDLVMVEVLDHNTPTYEYVNAFETPVNIFGKNPEVVKNSIRALKDYVDVMDDAFELPIRHRAYFSPRFSNEIHPQKAEIFDRFTDMILAVATWIKEN